MCKFTGFMADYIVDTRSRERNENPNSAGIENEDQIPRENPPRSLLGSNPVAPCHTKYCDIMITDINLNTEFNEGDAHQIFQGRKLDFGRHPKWTFEIPATLPGLYVTFKRGIDSTYRDSTCKVSALVFEPGKRDEERTYNFQLPHADTNFFSIELPMNSVYVEIMEAREGDRTLSFTCTLEIKRFN